MKYKAIIFDLDGTLIDSLHDIADALNNVLKSNGYQTHKAHEVKNFIGEGVKLLVERSLPANQQTESVIHNLLTQYRAEYHKLCCNKTVLYKGIPELLDHLSRHNYSLNVLSNKPDEFTQVICQHYLSPWKFEEIAGQKEGVPRKPDPSAVLAMACRLLFDPSEILYVGDSAVDIQTAHNAQMTAVAVTWGFRTRDEMAPYNPHFFINHPHELLAILGV
jgi:phosphoglycolate phosphatase